MTMGSDEIRLAQPDGGFPTVVAAGSAPGESGLSVLRLQARGGAQFSTILQQHLVCFMSPVRISCRMAGRSHTARTRRGWYSPAAGLRPAASVIEDPGPGVSDHTLGSATGLVLMPVHKDP